VLVRAGPLDLARRCLPCRERVIVHTRARTGPDGGGGAGVRGLANGRGWGDPLVKDDELRPVFKLVPGPQYGAWFSTPATPTNRVGYRRARPVRQSAWAGRWPDADAVRFGRTGCYQNYFDGRFGRDCLWRLASNSSPSAVKPIMVLEEAKHPTSLADGRWLRRSRRCRWRGPVGRRV